MLINCQNFLRLYFPMFQFRFLVRKNMVQTTSCFKPHYCLQWAQWRHNMAVVLPNMDIEPSKMANFKLAVNGYVFLYSSITISKLAKRAVFSHSRDVERYLKNKLFLEHSSPLTVLPSLNAFFFYQNVKGLLQNTLCFLHAFETKRCKQKFQITRSRVQSFS